MNSLKAKKEGFWGGEGVDGGTLFRLPTILGGTHLLSFLGGNLDLKYPFLFIFLLDC